MIRQRAYLLSYQRTDEEGVDEGESGVAVRAIDRVAVIEGLIDLLKSNHPGSGAAWAVPLLAKPDSSKATYDLSLARSDGGLDRHYRVTVVTLPESLGETAP